MDRVRCIPGGYNEEDDRGNAVRQHPKDLENVETSSRDARHEYQQAIQPVRSAEKATEGSCAALEPDLPSLVAATEDIRTSTVEDQSSSNSLVRNVWEQRKAVSGGCCRPLRRVHGHGWTRIYQRSLPLS